MHEECKHGIETAGHFHGVFETVPPCVIDVQELPLYFIPVWDCMDIGLFSGKIGCLKDGCGITSGKTYPGIFPGIVHICLVDDLGVGVDKKGITGI